MKAHEWNNRGRKVEFFVCKDFNAYVVINRMVYSEE